MLPSEMILAFYFGIIFDNGEILISFSGNLNLPEVMKSRCGTKIAFSSLLGKNRPTSGKSTALPY